MYRLAIVTFIDILGFRDLVATSTAETINKKLDRLNYFNMPAFMGNRNEDEYDPRIFSFSDSIVRVRIVDSEANMQQPMGLPFLELLDLARIQGELVQEELLIRGGVSYGRVFSEGNRVFGPALVAAYELESKFALYPRIVVDPTLLKEIKKNTFLRFNPGDWDLQEIRKLVSQGDDGLWFVDYARAIESELDEPEMYPIFLKAHKQLILKNARKVTSLSKELSKYLWLASYHNQVVSEMEDTRRRGYRIRKDTLTIKKSRMKFLQSLP